MEKVGRKPVRFMVRLRDAMSIMTLNRLVMLSTGRSIEWHVRSQVARARSMLDAMQEVVDVPNL